MFWCLLCILTRKRACHLLVEIIYQIFQHFNIFFGQKWTQKNPEKRVYNHLGATLYPILKGHLSYTNTHARPSLPVNPIPNLTPPTTQYIELSRKP